MIQINLDNFFPPVSVSINRQASFMEFFSPQRNGKDVLIRIDIKPHPDKLMLSVYNLAMGSLDEYNEIDDSVRLKHADSSKLFSTIILFALSFLERYPELIIGLDGSDDLRANLYHSMFLSNRKILGEVLISIGVDWYVKLLRNQTNIERDSNGLPFFKPRPELFDYTRKRNDLYRYYMFRLNNSL